MLYFKKGLMVNKFGKPWERTKRNRCFTTELLRACNRLIDTVSLQERSQYEVFSKFISKYNSFLAENYAELGFQGILFEKHRLILLMYKPNLNAALFLMGSIKDIPEDSSSTKYSFNVQDSPCPPEAIYRKRRV